MNTEIGWFKNTRTNNSHGIARSTLVLLVKTVSVRPRRQRGFCCSLLFPTSYKSLNPQQRYIQGKITPDLERQGKGGKAWKEQKGMKRDGFPHGGRVEGGPWLPPPPRSEVGFGLPLSHLSSCKCNSDLEAPSTTGLGDELSPPLCPKPPRKENKQALEQARRSFSGNGSSRPGKTAQDSGMLATNSCCFSRFTMLRDLCHLNRFLKKKPLMNGITCKGERMSGRKHRERYN